MPMVRSADFTRSDEGYYLNSARQFGGAHRILCLAELLRGVGVRGFLTLEMVENRWILTSWGFWPRKRRRVEPGLGRQVLRGARGVRLRGFSIEIETGCATWNSML